MKILYLALATGWILLIAGCKEDHLINDSSYRKTVNSDFLSRRDLAKARESELFSFTERNLKDERREAMEFLLAYSPLSDLAEYDANFFLENADLSLRTRKEAPWGRSVPESIFLHYVLPPRVNNENLDRFRIDYYNEISSRIKGLDAKSAALEINHWCHEKVSYQPSDIRTSAPESTMLSARGRCGEESTFTVAALRTAGLPSRQVYTPRWAHSDDNHAWVEVWIGGSWFYMGACEPEPVLDRGWFTEPARRAMLVHTKSFGAPYGEPDRISAHRNYSLINNTSKYAVTKTIFVKVLDGSGRPAEGATVEFQLYNYSEFYPIASIGSDRDGLCHFETGLGDLIIWAHRGDNFNYRKITVNETDTLTLVLDRKPEKDKFFEYDLGVPVTRSPYEGPSGDLVRNNNDRLNEENRIRQLYIDSWMKPGQAVALAISAGADTSAVKDIITRSMGNFKAVSSFISNSGKNDIQLAIKILSLISDKDLRDTKEEVLRDHLSNSVRLEKASFGYDQKIFDDYVLNPRIASEILAPWRGYLLGQLPEDVKKEALRDPGYIVKYVRDRITVNDSDNYYKTPITPSGVNRLRLADSFSRDIYFVALCRTLGIPARLEQGSNLPQYFTRGVWNDASLDSGNSKPSGRGYIKLFSSDKQPVPEYYIHFTLARFENGRYNTLEYDYNKRITDFREELALAPGYYMLVTGNRISDSRILSSMTFFELKENEHKPVEVKLRKDNSPPEVLGRISTDSDFFLPGGDSKHLDEFSGNGMVIAWIEPDKEPTRHILNDLPLLKNELDSWGGYFVFLSDPSVPVNSLSAAGSKNLPERSLFGFDRNSDILKQICGGVSCSTVRLPLVILVNKKGEILFKSEGYRIGIGEQILKKVR